MLADSFVRLCYPRLLSSVVAINPAVMLGSANKLSSAVATERQLLYLRTKLVLVPFSFSLISTFTPAIHGAVVPSSALYTQQRVL